MAELILIVFIVVVVFVLPEIRFNNYLPPEGQRVDHAAVNRDLVSGMSKSQVKSNIVNGKYNVKKDY